MKKVLILLMVTALLTGATAFANTRETPPGDSRWSVGIGGSFLQGAPVLDTWLGFHAVPRYLDMRLGVSYLQIIDPTVFVASGSLLVTPWFSDYIGMYIGVGVAGVITATGGGATGVFAVDGLLGMDVPISHDVGFYSQLRVLGSISGGVLTALFIPGFGFYLNL